LGAARSRRLRKKQSAGRLRRQNRLRVAEVLTGTDMAEVAY